MVKYKGGTVSLVPHIQGSKEAETSGKQIVASVDECQQMYNEVCMHALGFTSMSDVCIRNAHA